MPLPQPNLDDRTFDDLVAEARAMIPRLAPKWTNYNLSDPGITLIELFAWLTEMMLYRLNQVTDENYEMFLRLMGKPWNKGEDKFIESAVAHGLRFLQEPSRAVSLDDFEELALAFKPLDANGVAQAKILRVKALAPSNLERSTLNEEGHVSVVILPLPEVLGLTAKANSEVIRGKMPTDLLEEHHLNSLRKDVFDYLDSFRLLTTVVHVVLPEFQEISLSIKVKGRTGVNTKRLMDAVEERLRDFLSPYLGSENGAGWPFGLVVRRFELYQQIEAIESVDYVENLFFGGSLQANEIELQPNQLPCLKTIKVETL